MIERTSLFTVLGWEQRFLEGTNLILKSNNVHCVYLICFTDYMHMNNMKENLNIIKNTLAKNQIKLKLIELEYENSVSNWHILDSFFKKTDLQEVIINITTFPRETIWTLLFFLKKYISNLKYIYYKPKSYDKSEGGLTKNHKSPRLLFKHSGVFDINKKLAIFVITGFDHGRMDLIIEHYEPTKVVYISQKGEQFENMKRNSGVSPKTAYENVDVHNIEIDSYEINKSHATLTDLIEDHSEYNIIMTSQGPKTSAISTYLAYLENDHIALSYVPAREFSGDYSFGINETPVVGVIKF